ncbi:MAG: DsrE/DsrF/DrsH-like family protein [Spirochaetales bacterium]|nr:DsrE/DsrF/DrsH-like family protein [Spirochaetales bacterium]
MENSADNFKHITPQELDALDLSGVTLIDVRERAEALVNGIETAVNMPFSEGTDVYDAIPRNKPVIVYCRGGVLSRQAADILAAKGYDVATLDGGYNAYRMFKMGASASPKSGSCSIPPQSQGDNCGCSIQPQNQSNDCGSSAQISETIDAKNISCPGPIVRVSDALKDKPLGYRIMVEATEAAFTSDVAVWCERTGNRLDSLTNENGIIKAVITRAAVQPPAGSGRDKSFVIFSGDLDKTIAAFIIANGAASLGRKVTMFFTFWGLNILRRPEKVKVKKTFMEKIMSAVMPRGTSKLKLSQMNMCGFGAKMVRRTMQKKCNNSLEELIETAKSHGVRLVACQMSMDLLGIRQEELIDGIELGGVATFIGSGELSDMSLFI